ncbi:DEXDc2 [Musa troglodytarum]|uniref:DEXDc2 n=1 Tax=Musa troglodytarum TaxID=320322 RepID=A0A9E7ET50_9LILI|nr:DEXDc2 [Musa troglodytarum]
MRAPKNPSSKECSQNPAKGAAFLAVCEARYQKALTSQMKMLGNDIHVVLKKKYNDTYRSSKHLLSGSEWYCHQAFRALNQAADERFTEERNLTYISKWLKSSIKRFNSFDESLMGLRSFFQTAQKQFGQKDHPTSKNVSQTESDNSDFSEENSLSSKSSLNQGIQKEKVKKIKVNHQSARKTIHESRAAPAKNNKLIKSSSLAGESAPLFSSKDYFIKGGKASSETNIKPSIFHGDYVDPEESTQKQSKYLETISAGLCETKLHQPLVSESFIADDNNATCESVSKVESLYPAVAPFNQFRERSTLSPSTFSNGTISEDTLTSAGSPESNKCMDPFNLEKEIFLNMSVSSHSEKRRKLTDLQMTGLNQMDCISSDTESFYPVDSVSSISRETDQRSETPFSDNCSASQHQIPSQGMFIQNGDTSVEKKLILSCLCCNSPLGLQKNDFLVRCSLTSSSKAFLAYVLKHGPPTKGRLNCLRSIPETDVPVVACDSSAVDHHIFDKGSKEVASQDDFWSEEDGCVFRILNCPFCTARKPCLGVRIIAADASNSHLLNKVSMPISCSNAPGQGSAPTEIEGYSYESCPQKTGLLNARRSKIGKPSMREQACHLQNGRIQDLYGLSKIAILRFRESIYVYKKGKGFYHRDRLVVGVLFFERLPEFLPADPNKRNRINQEIKPKGDQKQQVGAHMKTKKALGGLLGLLGSLAAFVFLGFLPVRSGPFFTESLESIERTNQEITIRSLSPSFQTQIDPPAKPKGRRDAHLPSAFLGASAFDLPRFMVIPTPRTIRSVAGYPPTKKTNRDRNEGSKKVGIYLRSALFGGKRDGDSEKWSSHGKREMTSKSNGSKATEKRDICGRVYTSAIRVIAAGWHATISSALQRGSTE